MIEILLASYKGDAHILEQVVSIKKQTGVETCLLISDDYDVQKTEQMLYQHKDKVTIVKGPQKGVNSNFLHLIHLAHSSNNFFAYADQDDVWLKNKLSSAEYALKCCSNPINAYMGRTIVCDKNLQKLFLSKGKPRPAHFKNALIESIAGGNTMMFNNGTLSLLKKIQRPMHHDWLTYMTVTACGGMVVFDDTPYVLYRQHDNNLIGANRGIKAKWQRFKKLLNNEFYQWTTNNIKSLNTIRAEMTLENGRTFDDFIRMHEMNGWYLCFHRLHLFIRLGLYRQKRSEHIGFMLAAFLGKI